MARIVVGSPNLTQPLLLYPGLGPPILEQHRRSSTKDALSKKIYEHMMNLKSALHTSLTRKYLYATIIPVL
jgi:hypothetical protein